tara:strand:- start:1642 stop:2178 length:537 start_codon:yes stop_codon:yes gene_type:complete
VSKQSIRKKILLKRKKNYSHHLKINLSTIINLLNKKKLYKLTIGGYYPINYEINTIEILKSLEKKGHKISLPVIKKNNQIKFFRWSYTQPLFINKYGIPEPKNDAEVLPNVLFIPMVAFDRNKFRLGYGGGYYDRYLQKNKKKFISIGFAFSSQEIKKVPINKYDEKLDFILTEKEVF